ncbi:MAG: hypothetical protein LQ340_002579 [Diploschistes diacapsis]|nr:MAG: hypothetical protein LQ340_002579 [Diploschistes diacapsis]
MSAAPASSVPPQNVARAARKKKSKADTVGSASSDIATPASEEHKDVDPLSINGAEGSTESPYLRELSKHIRNVKKKLGATQKTDSIIAENPGKTIDQLLAERKLNADQKAQAEKKPGLQASLEQLEYQLEHYRKFDEESQKRLATEKASLEQTHRQELERATEAARAEAKETADKLVEEKLLILSRFLRAAAAKRSDGDDTAEENLAFEGALLLIYGGDYTAVQAMQNLIDGSDEIVPTVEGQPSNFPFKHIRDVAVESAPPYHPAQKTDVEEATVPEATDAPTEESTIAIDTDPTVANAGLTEINASGDVQVNGENMQIETQAVPEASSIDAGAANAAAEANWDVKMSQSVTSGPDGFELVEVPRDPAETETGLDATPAEPSGTQSWAEDVPTEPAPAPVSAAPVNDGFHEVVHHGRGRGRGAGHDGYRGRGGNRGDRGGRGRGPRGGRGRAGAGGAGDSSGGMGSGSSGWSGGAEAAQS